MISTLALAATVAGFPNPGLLQDGEPAAGARNDNSKVEAHDFRARFTDHGLTGWRSGDSCLTKLVKQNIENAVDINRPFLKGRIGLLLLNLLSRGEMYGYEILQETSRRSANAFEFKEGTLYPARHQLEKKGEIASEWRKAESGRERKYSSLTPARCGFRSNPQH
jgi:PadR family transcriptional regulator PadR